MSQRGIILAWAAGLALMSWREIRTYHKPPVPGRVLAASGVFAGLALLAAYDPATRAAGLAAWGFDVALFLRPGMLPSFMGGGQSPGVAPGPARAGRGGQGG